MDKVTTLASCPIYSINMNEQAIKFLENALKNNHCLIILDIIKKFNLKDRADFDKHLIQASNYHS